MITIHASHIKYISLYHDCSDLSHVLVFIIHPIHRFKSFDWLKESHMTWIIFRQCSCLQTNPCVLVFTISLTLRRSCHSCRIWNSIAYFPDFTIRYGLKKSMNGVYKTNIDCSSIRGMVENYCTLGKIQPLPTIHLGHYGPR